MVNPNKQPYPKSWSPHKVKVAPKLISNTSNRDNHVYRIEQSVTSYWGLKNVSRVQICIQFMQCFNIFSKLFGLLDGTLTDQ